MDVRHEWADCLNCTFNLAERLFGIKLSFGEKLLIRHEAFALFSGFYKEVFRDSKRAHSEYKTRDDVVERSIYLAAHHAIATYAEKFNAKMPNMEKRAEAITQEHAKDRHRGEFESIMSYIGGKVTPMRVLHGYLGHGGDGRHKSSRKHPLFQGSVPFYQDQENER